MRLANRFANAMANFLLGFNTMWTLCLCLRTALGMYDSPTTSITLLVVMPSLMSITVGVYIGLAVSDATNRASEMNLSSEHKNYGSTQPLWPKPVEAS